jgi:hypothetical protein
VEPNKSKANAETCQVGCTRVQFFTTPAIPVLPGTPLEPRRGRPDRSGAESQQTAASLVNGSPNTQTAVVLDTNRWQKGQEFALLDLVAALKFKSASSLSFELGTKGGDLWVPGMVEPRVIGPGMVFTVIGWVDVHYPCEGHIKTQLRVCLPKRYHEPEQMRNLVQQLFKELGIPADETHEAEFVAASKQTGVEQATDRHGMTDRLY